MKVGITGGHGFIGWHLRCYLKTRNDVEEVRIAGRETFAHPEQLQAFAVGLDLIVHLAGVNRAPEEEVFSQNILLADDLIRAVEAAAATPCIIYSSSTQAVDAKTSYGRGKAEAARRLAAWAKNSGGRFIELIVPHVFGEYGRPNYNSVVATFCHQITRGEAPSVTGNGLLTLVHVQDLVELIIGHYESNSVDQVRVDGREIYVSEVAALLEDMHTTYTKQGEFPQLSDPFNRALFNTLRAAMPHELRLFPAKPRIDNRGWLVETVKTQSGGQCFVSSTKPGITRGNHYHRRKVERFFVLQGQAQIRLRRLFTDEIITYSLDGSSPSCVDIPTLFTHNITNTGNDELLTLFWTDEVFDPANPDTFPEEV